jgi:hypothetical protein
MHKLYLSNKDKIQQEIDNLDVEGIFHDSVVQPHVTNPTKMCIAELGTNEETVEFGSR